MPEKLLSPQDLAAYLGKPIQSIYAMNHRGSAPRRIRVGRDIRYRLSDVEAWLSANRVDDGAA
ncbi:helix-turn-helix domain-containing protein [Nocardioides sp. NPDC004968]|uniref:helix-turn-helix transcriptional regulator n=1 Tax=Nocardioides sp. NPDC004968 TaxID=3155894 RepID=UPI0033BDCE29